MSIETLVERNYQEQKDKQQASLKIEYNTQLQATGKNLLLVEDTPELEYSTDPNTMIIKASTYQNPNQKATVIHVGNNVGILVTSGDKVYLRAHAAIGNSIIDPDTKIKYIVVDEAEILCVYVVRG
jgi:co-chaperonin GroES (HSP10)